jgi:hypothetical protein
LLQTAYSDDQTGAFENFHQPVENALIVLGLGLKVFFEYELRFANCLKGQLVISHGYLPIKRIGHTEKRKDESRPFRGKSSLFWNVCPGIFDQFLFQGRVTR